MSPKPLYYKKANIVETSRVNIPSQQHTAACSCLKLRMSPTLQAIWSCEVGPKKNSQPQNENTWPFPHTFSPPNIPQTTYPFEFGTLGVPSVCGLGRPLIRVNNHLVARNRPLALALFTTLNLASSSLTILKSTLIMIVHHALCSARTLPSLLSEMLLDPVAPSIWNPPYKIIQDHHLQAYPRWGQRVYPWAPWSAAFPHRRSKHLRVDLQRMKGVNVWKVCLVLSCNWWIHTLSDLGLPNIAWHDTGRL